MPTSLYNKIPTVGGESKLVAKVTWQVEFPKKLGWCDLPEKASAIIECAWNAKDPKSGMYRQYRTDKNARSPIASTSRP